MRYLIGLGLISLTLVLTFCSNERGPRRSVEERVENMKEVLQLSDEQAQKMTVILEEQGAEMKEIRENFAGDRSEIREAIGDIRSKYRKRIKALLTSEQLEEYEIWLQERRDRRRENR